MPRTRPTLTQFLIDERRRFPAASGHLNSLIIDVATTCKAIARAVSQGNLADLPGAPIAPPAPPAPPPVSPTSVMPSVTPSVGPATTPGTTPGTTPSTAPQSQTKLDAFSNDCFLRYNESSQNLAGLLSEDLSLPHQVPVGVPRGKYLLVFDPLHGSWNIDVNAPVGSIFSILRAPDPSREVTETDFLQKGAQQVAAGYAFYGPATMFVLSVGRGVHGFTLDPSLGDFFLTHPDMHVPAETQEFAINASNSRFWQTPVKRYVNECVAGTTGARAKDFNMRWVASLVADAHRLLLRGGVFLYPRDSRVAGNAGRLRLLYEANPIAFLVEQAGGRASTGEEPLLHIQPRQIHQQSPLVFGSRSEVERIEKYHSEPHTPLSVDPLFNERGLFRE